MRGLLLDTHIWFWHLIGSPRMPDGIRQELDRRPGKLWVSPVSIWELGKLKARLRVALPDDYRGWVKEARSRAPWQEATLNGEVALTSLEIELATDDPADRAIAATALVFDLELATADRTLLEADWLATVSGR